MPTGIYKRTQFHKLIISEALKKINHRPPIFIGEKSSNWKGGKIIRSGYIYIKSPYHPNRGKQGYVAEHRLVMENHIGRFLTRKEVVHHRNEIKTDNRVENLELCESAGKHIILFHPDVYEKNALINKSKRRSPKTEFKKGIIPWNKI